MFRLLTFGRLELQREDELSQPYALQPKRLALLTYLALSPVGTYHRRDILLALLWPERGHTEARHALRHALYHLRQTLGDGLLVSRGHDEVALAHEIWCDVRAFERKLESGNLREALALYRGDFLAGVFVDNASTEWEEWVCQTRNRWRSRAAGAAWAFAEQAVRSANVTRGLEAAWRARALDPDNEGGLRWLMRVLDQHGQRPAALQLYGDFARRMRGEYGAEPARETSALAEAIRSSVAPAVPSDGKEVYPPSTAPAAGGPITGTPATARSRPLGLRRLALARTCSLRTAARRRRARQAERRTGTARRPTTCNRGPVEDRASNGERFLAAHEEFGN